MSENNMSLRERIRRMIEEEIADLIGGPGFASEVDTDIDEPITEPADEPIAPVRRKRRSRRGPRIGYAVIFKARGRQTSPADLTPTIEKVWTAFRKSRKGSLTTAKDIEKTTGLGKKSVESAIWYLRQIKAIESREL